MRFYTASLSVIPLPANNCNHGNYLSSACSNASTAKYAESLNSRQMSFVHYCARISEREPKACCVQSVSSERICVITCYRVRLPWEDARSPTTTYWHWVLWESTLVSKAVEIITASALDPSLCFYLCPPIRHVAMRLFVKSIRNISIRAISKS
jgi:hypothetical protein